MKVIKTMGKPKSTAGGRGSSRTPAEVLATQTEDMLLDVERVLRGEKPSEGIITKEELLKDAANGGNLKAQVLLKEVQVKRVADSLGIKLDKFTPEALGEEILKNPQLVLKGPQAVEPVVSYTLSQRL
jgi:hypothetical protein